jgi:molecular chaperone GrpE
VTGSHHKSAPAADEAGEGFDSDPEQEPAPGDPLEAAQAELARVRDQLLRMAADFDNYRKRTRREVGDAERRAREELLRELLPVFDNLERAAIHTASASDVQAVADGVGLVIRQFGDTLSKLGIERIPTEGQAFDPTLHEAIQQLESRELAPGTIASEIQAGYRMGDRLIRPALVVVAKPPG